MLFPSARGRKSSREKILDAAAELVAEIGAGRLTLEAVAEKAGLSKGGLLYNFPTKDALLQAHDPAHDRPGCGREGGAAGNRRAGAEPGGTGRHQDPAQYLLRRQDAGIRHRHDGRHGREPAPPRPGARGDQHHPRSAEDHLGRSRRGPARLARDGGPEQSRDAQSQPVLGSRSRPDRRAPSTASSSKGIAE